jgi:hypothetical protein
MPTDPTCRDHPLTCDPLPSWVSSSASVGIVGVSSRDPTTPDRGVTAHHALLETEVVDAVWFDSIEALLPTIRRKLTAAGLDGHVIHRRRQLGGHRPITFALR